MRATTRSSNSTTTRSPKSKGSRVSPPTTNPPAPDFHQFARHNVRIVAAIARSDADAAIRSPESRPPAPEWTALSLVAERVPASLAEWAIERARNAGGGGSLSATQQGDERELAFHAGGGPLSHLLAELRALPAGGGVSEAIEHASASYLAALRDRRPTLVMGVINLTPDSFNPVGRFVDPEAAVEHALRLAGEGADILDVGGESTRPGANAVPAEEELARVLPVVSRLARQTEVPISVDTTKAEVAARCVEAGARWINDVSGLTLEPELARVAAEAGAKLVLMHLRGTPRTMQHNPIYRDVVADSLRFLRERVALAVEAGVPFANLVIDPGFGFGKTVAHNLEILRRLREYTSAGSPILVGTSRKSTIGRVLGGLPPEERLEGTAATVAAAILNGAAIVRVHDVEAMRRVAVMTDAIRLG